MIYFISGHRDLTIEEFKKHYIPKIDEVFAFDKTLSISFIIFSTSSLSFVPKTPNKTFLQVKTLLFKKNNLTLQAEQQFAQKSKHKNNI